MKTTKIEAGHYRVEKDGKTWMLTKRTDAPGYAGAVWVLLDQDAGCYTVHETKREALEDVTG